MQLFITYAAFVAFGSFVMYLFFLWVMASFVITYQKIDQAIRSREEADIPESSCQS